ncbi:MAG: pyruvate-formate lyase [Oscillospiraceae bacterium]|nr:pyruvate-formate lyase [Oscillospiraceae bacterium]
MLGLSQLNEEKIILSPLCAKRIKALHDDKQKINEEKIKALGSINIDDHGFVYFPDFKFTPTITRDYGKVTGMCEIGVNFRRFLNESPQYTNKNSALGGAWISYLANWVPMGIAPGDYPNDLKKIWDKYFITQPGFGAMNHCAGDIEIGLKLGWKGLLDKIRYYREFNNPSDTTFYDGEEELVTGIIEWVKKIADHAKKLAESEANQQDKNNLLEIAEMNYRLAEYPPSNMREACQFIAHFQSVDRMYFAGGALDQLDEKLRPYYEKDLKSGILTDEEAVWYIASLFFNDTHYSQIAGLTPDGSRDMTSRLSFIILDAMHYLKIPVNLAIRVHDNINKTLLRRSLEYMIEDGSGVCYSCNIGCEDGYAKNGFAPALGRMRAKVGCNWVAIPGREYPLQDVTRVNMAQAFVFALEDIENNKDYNLNILFDRFKYHLRIMIDSILAGFDRHFEVISRNTPEIVYNLFMHGPIERGLNCAEGGVDIMDLNIDGIALATVADSFAAIEQRIINEKKLTFEELFNVLDNNFEGKEDIRLMLKNIKRFGDPESLANSWAEKIRDEFVRLCRRNTPKYNIKTIPGMFSHGDIFSYGKNLQATPNGRFAGEPISHSNEPDPGFARGLDSFSPSLKATAVAKLQAGYGNSAPLHLDIDTNMLSANGGIDALISLIHTHNHMGGTLINMNCLSEQKLREAHEDPASHPDLVVRVTGYSAFFASLSKEYRQQIIDRFLSSKQVRL